MSSKVMYSTYRYLSYMQYFCRRFACIVSRIYNIYLYSFRFEFGFEFRFKLMIRHGWRLKSRKREEECECGWEMEKASYINVLRLYTTHIPVHQFSFSIPTTVHMNFIWKFECVLPNKEIFHKSFNFQIQFEDCTMRKECVEFSRNIFLA